MWVEILAMIKTIGIIAPLIFVFIIVLFFWMMNRMKGKK